MESGATITESSGAGAARIRVFGNRGRGFLEFFFFFRGGFGVGRFRLGGKPWVALLLFFFFAGEDF